MRPLAIEADRLSKSYRVYARPADRLWERVTRRSRHVEMRALQDVSFALPKGEGLGIVGENGAGKSTLLKLLAGVARPSGGRFQVNGRIAAILELGAGFHPDFSGRENALLNAALLGLAEPEVQEALPRIIEFAELGEFIDRPVKTYSTGMGMRLAFAIATQVRPDVLIVDEALSVGDGYFQKKCLDRMLGFIRDGGTVLFCSHAMYYITALCQHALWLRGGRCEMFGASLDVVREYEEHLAQRSGSAPVTGATVDAPVVVDGTAAPAALRGVRWVGGGETRLGGKLFVPGESWALEIEWQSDVPQRAFHLAVGIDRADGVQVCSFATHQDGLAPIAGATRHHVRLRLPRLPIQQGEFSLYVFLLDEGGLHVYDREVTHGAFRVDSPGYRVGLLQLEHSWEAAGAPDTATPAPRPSTLPAMPSRYNEPAALGGE